MAEEAIDLKRWLAGFLKHQLITDHVVCLLERLIWWFVLVTTTQISFGGTFRHTTCCEEKIPFKPGHKWRWRRVSRSCRWVFLHMGVSWKNSRSLQIPNRNGSNLKSQSNRFHKVLNLETDHQTSPRNLMVFFHQKDKPVEILAIGGWYSRTRVASISVFLRLEPLPVDPNLTCSKWYSYKSQVTNSLRVDFWSLYPKTTKNPKGQMAMNFLP